MPATPQDLFRFLADLGIDQATHEHVPVHTVEESRALRGILPGTHTKNLFLADRKKTYFLVCADEKTRVDLKHLHHALGCGRLSFGKPEALMEYLGVAPGSVTPFGLLNDSSHQVRIILDEEMMRGGQLNFHPLRNDATTAIARDDLVRFIRACGHEPRILRLDGQSE
jgi:Ala-tRNA(Pro) deacylase